MFKWFGKVNYSPYTKVSDFAQHLKDGRLMGTRCKDCGATSFPPRADCGSCMSGEFELVEMSGKGTLLTFTKIVAAPTGGAFSICHRCRGRRADDRWPTSCR